MKKWGEGVAPYDGKLGMMIDKSRATRTFHASKGIRPVHRAENS
jgi:hypothetical protein